MNQLFRSEQTLDIKSIYKKYSIHPRAVLHIGVSEEDNFNDYLDMELLYVLYTESNPAPYQRLLKKINPFHHVEGINCSVSDFNTAKQTEISAGKNSVSSLKIDTLLKEFEPVPGLINIISIDIPETDLTTVADETDIFSHVDAVLITVYNDSLLIDNAMDKEGFERAEILTEKLDRKKILYIRKPELSMLGIGYQGRFANQLFRYMFGNIMMFKGTHTVFFGHWIGEKLFDIPAQFPKRTFAQISESELESLEEVRNYDLMGYFMVNTSYYRPYKKQLQQLLQPHISIAEPLKKAYRQLKEGEKTVVTLHLRRGDYGYGCYFIAPNRWYIDWLETLWPTINNPVLYIATDDADAVIDSFSAYNPVIADDLGCDIAEAPFFLDYYIISQSDILAISNSSFSFHASMMNNKAQKFYRPQLSLEKLIEYDPWNSSPIIEDEKVEDYPHLATETTSCNNNLLLSKPRRIREKEYLKVNSNPTVVYFTGSKVLLDPLYYSSNEIIIAPNVIVKHQSIKTANSFTELDSTKDFTTIIVLTDMTKELPQIPRSFQGKKKLIINSFKLTEPNIETLATYIKQERFTTIIEEDYNRISPHLQPLIKQQIHSFPKPLYTLSPRIKKDYSFPLVFLHDEGEYNSEIYTYLCKYGIFPTVISTTFWESVNMLQDSLLVIDGTVGKDYNYCSLLPISQERALISNKSFPKYFTAGKTHLSFNSAEECLHQVLYGMNNSEEMFSIAKEGFLAYESHFEEMTENYMNAVSSFIDTERSDKERIVEELVQKKRYKEAVTALKEIINVEETSVWSLNCMGVILSNIGDFEGAEALFKDILNNTPVNKEVAYNLITVLNQQEKSLEANTWTDKYAQLFPNDPLFKN